MGGRGRVIGVGCRKLEALRSESGLRAGSGFRGSGSGWEERVGQAGAGGRIAGKGEGGQRGKSWTCRPREAVERRGSCGGPHRRAWGEYGLWKGHCQAAVFGFCKDCGGGGGARGCGVGPPTDFGHR